MRNNKELYQWFVENDSATTQVKIDKVRNTLNGKGNSFTLFEQELEDSNDLVELHINIDEYEDDNNPEQISYAVEVNTRHEENFKDIKEALDYYNKKIEELTSNQNKEIIEAFTQLKDSMQKVSTLLDNMKPKDTYNTIIDNFIEASFDSFDIPTHELNKVIQRFCSKSINDLKEKE
jgi:hypothetical protein